MLSEFDSCPHKNNGVTGSLMFCKEAISQHRSHSPPGNGQGSLEWIDAPGFVQCFTEAEDDDRTKLEDLEVSEKELEP